eukprot:1137809-Pelagomonas_calceolata.AAC.4
MALGSITAVSLEQQPIFFHQGRCLPCAGRVLGEGSSQASLIDPRALRFSMLARSDGEPSVIARLNI